MLWWPVPLAFFEILYPSVDMDGGGHCRPGAPGEPTLVNRVCEHLGPGIGRQRALELQAMIKMVPTLPQGLNPLYLHLFVGEM